MTDYDTFALFGAVYDNQDAAEMDYEAVKSLYYDMELIDNFDAAIVAKRHDRVGDHDACGARPLRGLLDVASSRGMDVAQLDLEHVRESSRLADLEGQARGLQAQLRELCGAGCLWPEQGDLEELVRLSAASHGEVTEAAVEAGAPYRSAVGEAEAARAVSGAKRTARTTLAAFRR